MSAGSPAYGASKTQARWDTARSRRRQCILNAAGTVFAQDGFERATMKHIAALCGVTKVTIYAHYPDKERLYRAVMDGHLAALPAAEPHLPAAMNLGDALKRITDGIRRLALDPSAQAFCRTLTRSELGRQDYMAAWSAALRPYLTLATHTFAQASAGVSPADDGEKFIRLIVAEHGLLQGSGPPSRSDTTVALFARAYGRGLPAP